MPPFVPRKPDAIRCPQNYGAGRPNEDKHMRRKLEFGPILGTTMVWSRELLDGRRESLVTASPHDHLLYAKDHPLAGQDRYEWFIAGRAEKDGPLIPIAPALGLLSEEGQLKLGYLKPEPVFEDDSVPIVGTLDDQIAAARDDPEFHAKLADLGIAQPRITSHPHKAEDPDAAR